MKKILLFFIVLVAILIGFSFIPVKDYELYKWNGIAYRQYPIPFTSKVIKIKFTGKSITYHDGTKSGMRTETQYMFGLKNGDEYFYNKYPNEIGSISHYKSGKEDGVSKSYYANGKLKYEIEYKEGKLNGSWKKYYTDGTTLGVHYIYRNGKRIKVLKQDADLLIGEFF